MTTLPVAPVQNPPQPDAGKAPTNHADMGYLLVVDDNDLNRDLLRRRLERDGYRVATLDSGEKLKSWVQSNKVDLVLMDVTMPGMDGLAALKFLRERYSPLQLPVIMVTGRSESSDVVEALNLGANDYVTKPIDFPVCLARIRTHLSAKRAKDALRQSEERYALAARGSNDGLWDWNLESNTIFFSSRWKAMLGWEEEEIGEDPEDWFRRVHPEDIERLKHEIQMHLEGFTPHYENEYRMLHRDGNYLWMMGRGMAIRDPWGKAYRMAGSLTDITRGKVADPLTGLPNRLLFRDRLGRMLERAQRLKDYVIAVIFVDLDDFKLINDSLGHSAGDELLITVARQIEDVIRTSDTVARLGKGHTVARLGGDEFIILLDNIKNSDNAIHVANRIKQMFEAPFSVTGHELFTSASMGIALNTAESRKPEDLLRDADTAMYQAKVNGKGRFEIFDSRMRADVTARLQLDTELRHAAARHEFENHYQPIVSLETGLIAGFETLVRWQHPSQGLLLPACFIKVAEDSGLLIPIEEEILEAACRSLHQWHVRFPYLSHLTVAVNLCSKHFLQPDLVPWIREIQARTGLPSSSLTLEITESTLMADPDAAADIMRQLQESSVKLALDDFGTGYSSLSYLHRFPLHTLKIDRSFVGGLGTNDKNIEMVRTIITLAHSLGMSVVAEGVETLEQAVALKMLGCAFAQGYYFSAALNVQGAADLLAANPRWVITDECQTKGALKACTPTLAAAQNGCGSFGTDRLNERDFII
jgi:diguanylate cyclase (GGDEF)-like protein/PAS domain S-box-containing protein